MTEQQSSNSIDELREQLANAQQELALFKEGHIIVQDNPQDKFLEILFEKGSNTFLEYAKLTTNSEQLSIKNESEIRKEELRTINKLDTKEKIYKGLLLGICIIALILTPFFIERAEIIIPVLSLIIGLLFKSNSVSDFISFSKRKEQAVDED